MLWFRRKTIFHVEESLPDPEELRLRFRRRVLLLSAVVFVGVLSIPVARGLYPDLTARAEARRFALRFLDTRLLASQARAPVSLDLTDDSRGWRQVFHASAEQCGSAKPGPEAYWRADGLSWKLQGQRENGETFSGRSLCLHPTQGLLLDGVQIGGGKLLVTVLRDGGEASTLPAAYLLVSQGGAEVQTLNAWKQ